jgi:hypothetical protein
MITTCCEHHSLDLDLDLERGARCHGLWTRRPIHQSGITLAVSKRVIHRWAH